MSAAVVEGRHRVVLLLGQPKRVVGLDRDLCDDVGAGEAVVVGKPLGGVVVSLGLVLRTVDGEQNRWVVGVAQPPFGRPLAGAGSPAGGERDDLVDLDGREVPVPRTNVIVVSV